MSGRLDGTAKYYYSTSGAVETRIYENGVLQGKAVKQSSGGEVEERNYVDGKLNGKATVLYTDSSKEMRTYKVRSIIIIATKLQLSFFGLQIQKYIFFVLYILHKYCVTLIPKGLLFI